MHDPEVLLMLFLLWCGGLLQMWNSTILEKRIEQLEKTKQKVNHES